MIRVYDYVLNDAQQQAVFSAYPYISENGLFTRTLVEGENDLQATKAWTNSKTYETADFPTANASVTLTLTADSSLTLNANQAIEKLTVNGSHTLTVKAGTGTVSVSDAAVINTPVVIPFGTILLAGTPITLGENGTLKFDCSALDISADYVVTTYQLTGLMDEDNTKVTATLPPDDAAHTIELVYVDGKYAIKVTPDHANGDRVFFNAASTYFDGKLENKVELEDGTKTILFPNDIVVLAEGKSLPAWGGKPACAGIAVEKDVTLGMGATSDVDTTVVAPALDGKTITVATGKTLTLDDSLRDWSLASVTINGPGAVLVKGDVTATAIAGTGTLKLANDATLTVDTELATGRVVSNVDDKSVKKEEVADNKTKYSLIDTSTAPIQPSDAPDADSVVIEDVGTGIAIAPNANVKVPTATTSDKIKVVYNGVELSTAVTEGEGQHPKYVNVTVNSATGAIELEPTDDAKPTVSAMGAQKEQETETDELSFTLTPIPGLFYSVVVGDSENGEFTSPDGMTPVQAKSSAPLTLTIPTANLPTGNTKNVVFFKIAVDAKK